MSMFFSTTLLREGSPRPPASSGRGIARGRALRCTTLEVPRKMAKELVLLGKKRRAAQGSKDLQVADNFCLVACATAAFDVGPIIVDAQGVNASEDVQKVSNDAWQRDDVYSDDWSEQS